MNHISVNRKKRLDPGAQRLVDRIGKRAGDLYRSRQMLCTKAVLVALNRGLDGGLTEAQSLAVAAPFCVALGDSGCVCGALSGAVMASGLFLGKDHPYRCRREMRESARELHDAFKARHGATCCRVLSKNVRHDASAHFRQCADLTTRAAEMAARLILRKRPGLLRAADNEYLDKRTSRFGGALNRLLCYFSR